MKLAVFSAKPYDEQYLGAAAAPTSHDLTFLEPRLTVRTAPLARGHDGVCAFVNDDLGAAVLETLAEEGVRLIALRSAGFNNVDLDAASQHDLVVVRVPAYSPYAVAEHALALILTLNRKIHRAHTRVREGNFALSGLLGFDLHGRTVGIVGTGTIGTVFARIMAGFGCNLLASDPYPNDTCRELGVTYVHHDDLFARSHIIALHAPLTPDTWHLVNRDTLARMQDGVMIINTSRGALVDTLAVIDGLKTGKVGHLGLDVYEEEADLFFEDRSESVIQDDVFSRLLTFPNVIITGHQAFFTEDALQHIAATTVGNLDAFVRGQASGNEVRLPPHG